MAVQFQRHVSTKRTPQSEPILGATQVENNAGGYSWAVGDWVRLDRFLVLGTEGGTYYTNEHKLTRDAGMLDVVGFDTATPQVISDFTAQAVTQ